MNSLTPNAVKLVKEAANKQLLPTNTEIINEAILEINKDYNNLMKLINEKAEESENTESTGLTPEQNLMYEKISRNKRGVMLYLNERMTKIENLVWEYGESIPDHIYEKFDEADKHYCQEYLKNFEKYYKTIVYDINMDLSNQLVPPTNNIFISCKAEKTIEKFKPSYVDKEDMLLEKGSSYVFKKTDIEGYVRKGVLSYND